jgi:hypothetical protein
LPWPSRALRLLLAVLALVMGMTARADEITAMRVERTAEGLMLSAQVRFDLPAGVDEALQKGIPMFFVAEAALTRDRWYWYDKEVARVHGHHQKIKKRPTQLGVFI